MNSWLELLIGAIFGVIATRLLDKPIERRQRAFSYWLRSVVAKFRKIDIVSVAQDEFRIGSKRRTTSRKHKHNWKKKMGGASFTTVRRSLWKE